MASDLLRLESHGPDQGLPQSTVHALATDDQGFLWVATQDGLARFDGHRFQVWRDRDDDAERGLASSGIDAMAFDGASRSLWLGTNDAGLEVVHLPTWSRLHVNRGHGLAHQQVTAVALDGQGGAWVGGGAGLDHVATADAATAHAAAGRGAAWSAAPGQAAPERAGQGGERSGQGEDLSVQAQAAPASRAAVRHLGGEAEVAGIAALPGGGVALALGRDCRLWKATRTRLDLLATLPSRNDDCVALRLAPDGLWVASEHAGLFLLDVADGRVLRTLPRAALLPGAAPVSALLQRRDGSLLVGMRDGRIASLATANARPVPVQLDRPLVNPVTSLHEGAADSLWIGSYTSGLHHARPLSAVVRVGGAESGLPEGWPAASMRAIWSAGGHVLLGYDGGLFERRPGATRWRQIDEFDGRSVRAISRGATGDWWIGTHDGLFRWRSGGGAHAIPGLPDNRVDVLLLDGDSGWVGTRAGLARLRDGRIEDDPVLAPLRHSLVTALLRRDQQLWIATNADGLWRSTAGAAPVRVQAQALHHSLWSLLADGQALWVGSYGRGIHRIDDADGTVTDTRRRDGLGNNVVYSLLADDLGRIWASTNNGLSVLDPASGTIQVLGPRDGLANREYNSSSAFRDADGLLYFGGTRGIDVLRPSELPRHSAPARPVLTTLRVSSLDGDGAGTRETDIVYAHQAGFVHRDRMVTVRMTAIDFAAPDAAQLRYRVLGLHPDWVYAQAPTAEFSVTALPPGDYVLEVEAAGRDGRFGQARTLALHMAPPWWRHPLAYAGYALALMLLMALVARRVRSAMRRERRQVELLERTVAERTAQLQLANERLSDTNAQLSIATRRDPLTRISNRRDLQEWLGREAAELRRRMEAADGGQDRLVFFMIDIDDFKGVNDAYGHQAGDEVLVHFADRLRLLSREDDLLVRWGGEEFLLISRFARLADAAVLAERIRSAIAGQPIRLGRGVALDLSCSIGFAPWPFALEWPELGDWSACVGLADRCLYAVKRAGKDGWMGMVPGESPRAGALQALLDGAHPQDVGAATVQVLHSGSECPRLVT